MDLIMRIKLGPDSGNKGGLIRFGKYLDKGLWLTDPALRGWQFRPLGFLRLWFIDLHLR